MHRAGNEIFIDAGTQTLLTELEDKRLEWFGHVERMGRIKI
jgi:hypothetical protein